jgi:hypothetical protein
VLLIVTSTLWKLVANKCIFSKAYSDSNLAVLIETAMKIRIYTLLFCYIALAALIETAMKIKCTICLLKHIAISLLSYIETAMKIGIYTTFFAIQHLLSL